MYGSPPPFITFTRAADDPERSGSVRVTSGGDLFSLSSVDLYSSITPVSYVFTGLRNSATVYSVSGAVPNPFGKYARVSNPESDKLVDALQIIIISNSASCCANSVGLDNIIVNRAGVIPTLSQWAMVLMSGLLGLIGAVLARRGKQWFNSMPPRALD
jgi:hypothetical protein